MQSAEPINNNKVRQETTDWQTIINHLNYTKQEKAIIETYDSWDDSWNFHWLLSTITACLAQALASCMTYKWTNENWRTLGVCFRKVSPSVLVNFIVNLMLGNYLTTILEENVFKKEEELLQRGRHLLWQINGVAVEVIYSQ